MWRMGGRHSYANYPPMTSSPSTAPPRPTIYRRFSSTSSWARLRGCYWWHRKWLTRRGSGGFDSCVYWGDKYFSYLSFTPVSEAVYKRFIKICQYQIMLNKRLNPIFFFWISTSIFCMRVPFVKTRLHYFFKFIDP